MSCVYCIPCVGSQAKYWQSIVQMSTCRPQSLHTGIPPKGGNRRVCAGLPCLEDFLGLRLKDVPTFWLLRPFHWIKGLAFQPPFRGRKSHYLAMPSSKCHEAQSQLTGSSPCTGNFLMGEMPSARVSCLLNTAEAASLQLALFLLLSLGGTGCFRLLRAE